MSNVINKGWIYSRPDQAIGSPEDEPATDVNAPQSLISLLKAILLNGSVTAMTLGGERLANLEQRIKALEDKSGAP